MKFYMLIGIPGSGKSTWANEEQFKYDKMFRILSSDLIREELFGDASSQQNNSKVFEIMNSRTIDFLGHGCNVCYDATNINRKSRKTILKKIKEKFKDSVEIIGVCFITDRETCFKNNQNRERKVPDYVIDKMIRNFEIPFLGEGFSDIIFIDNSEHEKINWYDAQESMKGFDQNNPNHHLTLLEHCDRCMEYVVSKNTEYDIQPELSMAAALHDYGKLFTATYDHIKNYTHYYRHENVGAYYILSMLKFPEYIDKFKVAFYVNYHMEPYRLSNATEKKLNYYKNQFGKEWVWITILHEGDVYAH